MSTIELDATEFGQHVRAGGWRLGLLVARNVKPGRGGERTLPTGSIAPVDKVSATKFGQLAGTHHTRVMRYLRAWDAAAQDGVVPAAEDLSPGSEVDLDATDLPKWSDYYDTGGTGWTKATAEVRADYEKIAKTAGITARQVAQFAGDPETILGTINTDPELRREIAKELRKAQAAERKAEQRNAPAVEAPPRPPVDPTFSGLRRMLENIVAELQQQRYNVSNPEVVLDDAMKRDLLYRVQLVRDEVDMIQSAIAGPDWDAELTEILEEGTA